MYFLLKQKKSQYFIYKLSFFLNFFLAGKIVNKQAVKASQFCEKSEIFHSKKYKKISFLLFFIYHHAKMNLPKKKKKRELKIHFIFK